MGERDSKCRAQTLEPAWALEEQQEDYWLEKNGGGGWSRWDQGGGQGPTCLPRSSCSLFPSSGTELLMFSLTHNHPE